MENALVSQRSVCGACRSPKISGIQFCDACLVFHIYEPNSLVPLRRPRQSLDKRVAVTAQLLKVANLYAELQREYEKYQDSFQATIWPCELVFRPLNYPSGTENLKKRTRLS